MSPRQPRTQALFLGTRLPQGALIATDVFKSFWDQLSWFNMLFLKMLVSSYTTNLTYMFHFYVIKLTKYDEER